MPYTTTTITANGRTRTEVSVLTLLQVAMLIHYYCLPTAYSKHDPAHANSDAVQEQRKYLIREGLLEERPSGKPQHYMVTERGRAYIKRLERTPLPTQHWGYDDEF